MKKFLLMTFAALLCVSLCSCGDDDPEPDNKPIVGPEKPNEPDPEPENPETPDNPPLTQSYTLYATGYSDVIMYSYWWNSEDKKLEQLCADKESAESYAIAVTDDGTVYVGGMLTSDSMDGYEAAALWKNGQSMLLTKMDRPTDAAVYGLAVDGNDVWAAGFYRYLRVDEWSFQRDAATIWKNGEMIELTHGERYAKAWSIDVTGDDVYVAGEQTNADGIAVATLWKGNKNSIDWSGCEVTALSDGKVHAYAESLCVDGQDVYVAGNKSTGGEAKVAVMWKNGTENILSSLESYATSICVNDGKVYVAGWEYVEISGRKCAVATLWVDGEAQHMYDQPRSSQARCVVAKGSDVYVSGFIGDQAVIWINGKAGAVTDGSYPTCITSLYLK